jgi:lysophospholipase L1-like esterase
MADQVNLENPNPDAKSKLEELADKSALKNHGSTAHYIVANQALKEDLLVFLNEKFACMQREINQLKSEIQNSRKTETELLNKIEVLSANQAPQKPNRDEIYIVGSSVLREIRDEDIVNGTIKSISGGKVKDVKQDIESLKIKPKTIITQVGGNDVDSSNASVEDVVSEYAMALTQTKAKLPDTKLVVAGLPPRHHSTEIRTKVKDYNEEMNKWCKANNIDFIDNEMLYEFKTGEVDVSSYIMTGVTPAVHLTQPATLRMLENLKKTVPDIILSNTLHQPEQKKTYANAVASRPTFGRSTYTRSNDRNGTQRKNNNQVSQVCCWFCGVPGHKKDTCRHQQPIRCHSCSSYGHKMKYCQKTTG